MKRVITYGTYDLLHYGHIRLLQRAKALGDYLIVGVTSDAFDRSRGKINVQQSLMERVEAVRNTGIADQIVVEEYEGQKIDDIIRYKVDIFTVGSDWQGVFDYLNEYCDVVYLDRTQGVSSSELRSASRKEHIGIVGGSPNAVQIMEKFERESHYVNGVDVSAICTDADNLPSNLRSLPIVTSDFNTLLGNVDAVYIASRPSNHYSQIRKAIEQGKHVLCESPIAIDNREWLDLRDLAIRRGVILMDAIKTAYSTAFNRLIVLAKSGRIGDIVSVNATCTSLSQLHLISANNSWNTISAWGPTALLPVFQLIGTNPIDCQIYSKMASDDNTFDLFSKINLHYSHAVASVIVGQGVKSEGELIVSGTKGYIYVPAPWWKTDYFELRYENQSDNKRYFYQLEGEGIRNMIVAFIKAIHGEESSILIDNRISEAIVSVLNQYYKKQITKI